LLKELAVAALNGLVWAAVVGAYTMAIYGEWRLAGIIFAALIINLLFAAIVGVTVPLFLKKIRVDPALASGVILTTFTDSGSSRLRKHPGTFPVSLRPFPGLFHIPPIHRPIQE
jgi:Mg/Co/Ni transporter MgtE